MRTTELCTLSMAALLLMITSIEGCHYAGQREFGKGKVVKFFSSCLSKKTGSYRYRWNAVARFAIEDTFWFDKVSNRYCKESDTVECWKKQIDFLIASYSYYADLVKSCVSEYRASMEPKSKPTVPKPKFDDGGYKIQGEHSPLPVDHSRNLAPTTTTLDHNISDGGVVYTVTTKSEFQYSNNSSVGKPDLESAQDDAEAARSGRGKRSTSNLSSLLWHFIAAQQRSSNGENAQPQNATNHQSSNAALLPASNTPPSTIYGPANPAIFNFVPTTPKPTVFANQYYPMHVPHPNWLPPIPSPVTVSTPYSETFSFTSQLPAPYYPQEQGENRSPFSLPSDAYQTFPAWWPQPTAYSQYASDTPFTTLPPFPYSSTFSNNLHPNSQQAFENQPQPGNHYPFHSSTQPPTQTPPYYPQQPSTYNPEPSFTSQKALTATPHHLHEDNSELSERDETLLQLLQLTDKIPATTTSSNLSVEELLKLLKSPSDKPSVSPQGKEQGYPAANPLTASTSCDQSKSRFNECVKARLESRPRGARFLLPGSSAALFSPEDVDSILNFFDENHSKCTSHFVKNAQTGVLTRQCRMRSARNGALTCLPTIMQRLAKNGTTIGNIFQTCT